MKLDLYLIPYAKKITQNVSRLKDLKLNISVNLHDLESGNGFLNMISKAQATKGIKQIKSDINKMKTFCAS